VRLGVVTRFSRGAKPQMTQTQDTRTLPTPAAVGLPPLLRVDDLARGGLHLSHVSSHDIVVAKANIQNSIWALRRLSRSINAWAADDAFDEPNAADLVIDDLESALTALGGQG
jgi:hypothetical protein